MACSVVSDDDHATLPAVHHQSLWKSRHPSEGWDPVLRQSAKKLDSSLRWNDEKRLCSEFSKRGSCPLRNIAFRVACDSL
jgi:hypothetical protein